MVDERPPIPATVERSASGSVRNFIQKLAEPRVLGWIAVVSVLIIWEVVVAAAHLNPIYLPRPTQILIALVAMFKTGGLLSDLLATLGRIFGGFAISLVIGTLLGIWMASSERVSAIADNFIAALYPLPKVTLIPLLIIWLGTGGPFMLTISALGAIFPIVINTVLGIRQCRLGPHTGSARPRRKQSPGDPHGLVAVGGSLDFCRCSSRNRGLYHIGRCR